MEGIDPSTLTYDMEPTYSPMPDRFEDAVPDKEARFRAVAAAWIDDRYGGYHGGADSFNWPNHGHRAPVELLEQAFTWDERVQIWAAGVVESDFCRHIEEKHPLLWKVANCMWHHGCGRDYNTIARAMSAIRRLDWGVPGFDGRIVHTRGCNVQAYAEQVRELYLDNALGVLLYNGEKHVLTVGWGLGEEGVYVTQAQLRQKKGNRWLYKLPAHYLDMALDMFARAFEDWPIWLIDGKRGASAIRRSYADEKCNMTPEDEARIASLYDRPLAKYVRSKETVRRNGRDYVLLKYKVGNV